MIEFKIAPKIVFGVNSLEKIKDELKAIGANKLLVVTDEGIIKAGLFGSIEKYLGDFNVTVFKDVVPNPKDTNVESGLRVLQENGCDSVLGVGGGSPMDTAKVIAAMATNPGKVVDYAGIDKFKNPAVPLALIPTTAGTGAEVSRSAMITSTSRNYKMLLLSWALSARVAILDPTLTLSTPPRTTAYVGMDAMSHAMESYVSKGANPLTEIFSLKSIELLYANMREAVKNGKNLEARTNMLLGSLLAGVSMANARLGNVHSLAHSLGGQFDVPHGLACAMLLPIVMEFNLEHSLEKFKKAAEVMGKDVSGLSVRDAALKSVKAIEELCQDLGIPKNLSDCKISKSAIPQLVNDAVIFPVNPRPTTKEDLASLFEKVI